MATKKMTKRDYFNALRAIVADNEELTAFIDHEIKLLEKKSGGSRKPTARQLENEVFKADIVSYLIQCDTMKCITELQNEIPSLAELSNQRITHLLTALKKEGKVNKEYVKKTPYFYAVK